MANVFAGIPGTQPQPANPVSLPMWGEYSDEETTSPQPTLDCVVITQVENGYLIQVRLDPDVLSLTRGAYIAKNLVEVNEHIRTILELYPRA